MNEFKNNTWFPKCTGLCRWLVPILLIGCGQKSAPPAKPNVPASAPVAQTTAAPPAAPAVDPNFNPMHLEQAIGNKVKDLMNRKVKLGEKSNNQESYSSMQARNQAWLRNLIKSGFDLTTTADSPLRQQSGKLVEAVTILEPTDVDASTASQMFQELSAQGQNPILDMEYASFLISRERSPVDVERGQLIWTLLSRGWSSLPEQTSPILKLRYLAAQEDFSRMGGQEWITPTRKSLEEQAKKVIPAVLESPIPESEQQFVRPYLHHAVMWTGNGGQMPKLQPITPSEPNRWLKMMARAYLARELGQGRAAQGPGTVSIQRTALMEAWNLHPERPEAATELIRLAARSGGESARFWFDEATLAQFDYIPAYEAYAHTVRGPRGNPLAPMFGRNAATRDEKPNPAFLEFCIECLDTGRMDTPVPTFMIGLLDARTISGSPYEARLREAMTNLMASPKLTSLQRHYYSSQLAVLDWKSGKFEAAEQRITELGENADVLTFLKLGVSVSQVLEECAEHARANQPATSQSGPWHISPWRRTLNVGGWVWKLKFSPDGKRMVVTSNSKLNVWITADWTNVWFEGERHLIKDLDFTRDSSTLVTISEDMDDYQPQHDGGIILWDLATGKIKTRLTDEYETTLPQPKTKRPANKPIVFAGNAIAIAPDGKTLYSGHSMFAEQIVRNGVAMWNLQTGKIWNVSNETGSTLTGMALASDGKILMSGGSGKTRGWEIPSEQEWPREPGGKQFVSSFALKDPRSHCEGYRIRSISFHPNNKWCAIGIQEFRGGRFELWDIAERKLLAIDDGMFPAFSPDGRILAAETYDCRVALYEVPSCERKLMCLNAHADMIKSLAFHPSGRYLAALSEDGTVSFWDPNTGKPADIVNSDAK